MIDKNKILDFVKKQNVAFITSVDEDGFPTMKAMFNPRKIDGNRFYFTTNTSSLRVKQYKKNEKARMMYPR
jgi:Uncharacterized stress protein (general stress protein 26)